MALLFSQVTVTAGNDTVSFLVGGIPREYDDLEDWDEFDDFLKNISMKKQKCWFMPMLTSMAREKQAKHPIRIFCSFPHGLNPAAVSLQITVTI